MSTASAVVRCGGIRKKSLDGSAIGGGCTGGLVMCEDTTGEIGVGRVDPESVPLVRQICRTSIAAALTTCLNDGFQIVKLSRHNVESPCKSLGHAFESLLWRLREVHARVASLFT